MARVMFTRRPLPHEVAAGETYEPGQVYDLPAASVARWKRRGAVVDAPPEPVPALDVTVDAVSAEPAPQSEPVAAEPVPAPEPESVERPAPRKRKAKAEPTD